LRDSAGLLVPHAGYSCESPASPLNLPIRGIRYLERVWIDNVLNLFYTRLAGTNVMFSRMIISKSVERLS
jgi:hypothetical protein